MVIWPTPLTPQLSVWFIETPQYTTIYLCTNCMQWTFVLNNIEMSIYVDVNEHTIQRDNRTHKVRIWLGQSVFVCTYVDMCYLYLNV